MNTYSSFVIKRTGVIQGVLKTPSGTKSVGLSSLINHLKYVGFRSRELNEKGFFDRHSDSADYRSFVKRIESNRALKHSLCIKAHKLIFALHEKDYKAYLRSGKDFKDIIRSTLDQYEKEKGVKLDWIANIHNANSKNPHCHVIIKGVSDKKGDRGYTRIKFTGSDFKRMREIFRDVFERDVRYNLRERTELMLIKNNDAKSRVDIGHGIEAFTKAFSRQIKKEKEMNEFEKRIKQRRDEKIREFEERKKKERER